MVLNKRHCGILLHLTSLPSKYGIGDMGPAAYAFLDFAASCHQKYWQILPINPTDGINGNSPYSCSCSFAGNPLLISPQLMVQEGFVTLNEIKYTADFDETSLDYAKVKAYKDRIFKIAFQRFQNNHHKPDRYKHFIDKQKKWLDDFALFVVIKSVYQGRCWNEWPPSLKNRSKKALKVFARKYGQDIEQAKFIQYIFFQQWYKLKAYAASKNIAIIGDIPIYVNYDSRDVWCYPSFFKVDKQKALSFVSGCPPDYFSKTGQRWGNPVYDWAHLKKAKYSWWMARIAHALTLFDYLRIDHFRGFAGFWQIPAHEKLAVFGRWVKGPGEHFLNALSRRFGRLPIIAEDLGDITLDVLDLMKKFGFPGMRVLLFAFSGDMRSNPHVPSNYPVHCVAYTGTHDNNTIKGWYEKEAKPHERINVPVVLKNKKVLPALLHWTMIEVLMRSKADCAMVPMADYLGLGEEGRMNTPATTDHNWQWRMKASALNPALSSKIEGLVRKTNR